MDGQQHQIKQAAEQMGKSIGGVGDQMKEQMKALGDNPEMKEAFATMPDELKDMVSSYARDSASAKEAMGLTDGMIEGIYGQAYRMYNTGKYKEASQLFRLLMLLDPKQPKYILGLAACFHMLKEFKNAVQIYTMCGLMDPESPIPHYHLSDCYIQMNDKVSALISLEMAVTRAEGKAEYQILKDRAQLTIENLKKEIMPKQL